MYVSVHAGAISFGSILDYHYYFHFLILIIVTKYTSNNARLPLNNNLLF